MKKLSILLVLGSFYTISAAPEVSGQSQASYASNLAQTGAQFTAEMLAYAQRNSASDEEFTKLVSTYFQELATKTAQLLPPATMTATVKSLTDSVLAKVQESLISSLTGHQTSLSAASDKTSEPEKPTLPTENKSSETLSAPPAVPVLPEATPATDDTPFTFQRESTKSDEDESAGLHDDMTTAADHTNSLNEPSTNPMPLNQVKVQSISSSPSIEIYENKKGEKGPKGAALGTYNKKSKTAKMNDGTYYTDVVEYKAAVTPPSTDGKHVAFAQIPNPAYQEGPKKVMGGASKMITLYGIVDTGKAEVAQKPASLVRPHAAQAPQPATGITPGMKLAATAKLLKNQPSNNQPAQAKALEQAMPDTIPAMPTFAPGIQMPQPAQTPTPNKTRRMPVTPSFAPAPTTAAAA